MNERVRRASLLAGLVLGCVSALLTVSLGVLPVSAGLIMVLMPGLLLAIRIEGAEGVWIAAFGNLAFWLLLCWLVGFVMEKVRGLRISFRKT